MKPLALAVLLTGAAFVSPQQTTIAVVNISESGSPVLLSGTVTAGDEGSGVLRYSLTKDISCTNVSTKNILLAITRIKVTRLTTIDVDETRSEDYFFTSEVLKPDATDVWHDSFGPFGKPTGETELKPEEPRAAARIIFVQFADGSIWGDPTQAEDALRDRADTERELKLLVETYRTQGNEQFLTELTKPTRLGGIGILQRLYADTKDTDRVIRKVVSMLKCADLHQSAITTLAP
jgi:hypothetical protein